MLNNQIFGSSPASKIMVDIMNENGIKTRKVGHLLQTFDSLLSGINPLTKSDRAYMARLIYTDSLKKCEILEKPIITYAKSVIKSKYNDYIKKIRMKINAHVVLINKDGLVLGVSRKHDKNDFGLIGGKMDECDNNDPKATAIRETLEETGLTITNLRLIYTSHRNGTLGYTYLADYTGEINHDEPHEVQWLPFEVLFNGSFGKYNKMVAEALTNNKIEFKK